MTATSAPGRRRDVTGRVLTAIRDAGELGSTVPQIKAALGLRHKETVTRILRRLRGQGVVVRWQRGQWTGRYADVRYVAVTT